MLSRERSEVPQPYHAATLAIALVASVALSAGPIPIPSDRWSSPEDSLGSLAAFRVRVDVHARTEQFRTVLGGRLQEQIERALRAKGIDIVAPSPATIPTLDGIGELVVDVHVLDTDAGTAMGWTLRAAQPVRLPTGLWTSGSTWQVGALVHAPTSATIVALRNSLQPALDELCKRYLAARSVRAREQQPPPEAGTVL